MSCRLKAGLKSVGAERLPLVKMSTIGQEQACLTLFGCIRSHLQQQERQAHRKQQLSPLVLALVGRWGSHARLQFVWPLWSLCAEGGKECGR
jgi:hypothetical protein